MKHITKLATLALAVLAAACSTEQEVLPTITESDAIQFGSFTDQATKGSILTNTSITGYYNNGTWISGYGFGVFGFDTGLSAWASTTSTPNLMHNQEVTNNGSSWYYSPLKYWSNIEDNQYTFFAYAPYSAASSHGITPSSSEAIGTPTIKFAIQSNAEDMVDFVAGQVIDVEQQTAAITFNLKHQLTRVMFSATSNQSDENTSFVITDMAILASDGFFNSATYTFNSEDSDQDETEHSQDGTWSAFSKYASESYSIASLLNIPTDGNGVTVETSNSSATPLFASGEYLFLIPPTVAGITEETPIQFTITYQVVTKDSNLGDTGYVSSPKTATISLPAGALAQGKAYNINLSIELTAINISATIVDWSDEVDVTVAEEEEEETEE